MGLLQNPAVSIVVGLAVVAFIIYRQLQRRRVRESSGFRAVVILGLIGVFEAAGAGSKVSTAVILTTVLSLVVGAALGLLRGRFVHLFREGGSLYRQGNVVTIVLWLVGIGLHIGLDALGGGLSDATTAAHGGSFGSSTILLYIAVSLGAQQVMVLRRARNLSPSLA